ncbi:MAG: hypothetical protein ACK55I_13890, partial [bacterium]
IALARFEERLRQTSTQQPILGQSCDRCPQRVTAGRRHRRRDLGHRGNRQRWGNAHRAHRWRHRLADVLGSVFDECLAQIRTVERSRRIHRGGGWRQAGGVVRLGPRG